MYGTPGKVYHELLKPTFWFEASCRAGEPDGSPVVVHHVVHPLLAVTLEPINEGIVSFRTVFGVVEVSQAIFCSKQIVGIVK